ncbi:small ribosomal subunit protein mS31 [Topomyia yanbarensis]|uniref:small ribosomal subunit protein mS31 n=1 Tax=Topomyia yanbarensis TaxID=2498891 RepID=UPI00273BFF01|nr:small ribosomal subunit protein mS31 [Topomyia yanbarensis]
MLQGIRLNLNRLYKRSHSLRLIVNSDFCSDSGQRDDGGNEKKIPSKPEKQVDKSDRKSTATMNRLNELLSMMSTNTEVKLIKKVQIAKPQSNRRERSKESKEKSSKKEDSDSDDEKPANLEKATRQVAVSLGGDAKKTEAELLAKLLGRSEAGGDSLSDIITGMQVDKDGSKQREDIQLTRSSVVRKSIERKAMKEHPGTARERKRPTVMVQRTGASVKLFGEEPLNIFTDPTTLEDSPDMLKTWKKLQDRELRLAVAHPPANHFQKMALWTEQGKLWKFPINNEQGLEEEAKVSFTDHIFLEEHLEGWCPQRGPIRHFMELVCVGLSKNYFISAQEKKEHILWFRDYFEQKKDLLQQVIVQQSEASEKQIEK